MIVNILKMREGSYLAFNVFSRRLLSVSERPPGKIIDLDKSAVWKGYSGIVNLLSSFYWAKKRKEKKNIKIMQEWLTFSQNTTSSLGNGRRLGFWKDPWCGETVLCNAFPTLFNLVVHKDVRVVDVWNSSREDGGWSPVFLRPFNDWGVEEVERFLHFLHNKKIRPFQEDRLLLKETMTDGFSVRLMYRKLMHSLPTDSFVVPSGTQSFPSNWVFFPWEASWGKVLTLDQLKRRGIPLVNKCFLCEDDEETIDHLLIHCSRAKML